MKKLKQSLSVTAATLGILGIFMTNPALAALFKLGFCGSFEGLIPSNPDNKVLPSYITVESTETGDSNFGIKEAKIETQRVDLTPSIVSYNLSNLVSSVLNAGIVTWTFNNAGNIFTLNIPQTIVDDLENLDGDVVNITNQEQRLNQPPVSDPDDLEIRAVPEPTTILGTSLALGLGGLLTKRNLKKLNEDEDAA